MVAAPPAVMSLVTPTPACTGETDREPRPRCSIVDRERGCMASRSVQVAVAVVVVPFEVCRQRRCTTMG